MEGTGRQSQKWAISGRSTPKTINEDIQKQVRTLTQERQRIPYVNDTADDQKETVYALSKKDIISRLKNIYH